MDYHEEQWARQVLREEYPGQDTDAHVIQYFDSWSDYEENGWMFILEKDKQLYILHYAYSVYGDRVSNTPYWDLIPVTEDEAIQEMLVYDAGLRENELRTGG